MKKALAVLLSLVMVFALCVPSFAEGESSFIDEIGQTISSLIDRIVNGDSEGGETSDIGAFIDSIINGGGEGSETPALPDVDMSDLTPEQAAQIIAVMQKTGASKEDIQAVLDQMLADGQLTQEAYDLLTAALEEASETPDTPVEVPDAQVTEVAQRVIDSLKQAGVTDEQLQGVVDQLYERGIVPENVYNEITNIINASEATTAASNEGGIGSFLGGIVDTIKGFLGLGGDENTGDGDGSNSTPGNSSDFGAKDPTGDTALISVAAVAAVAGVALVLTKKKQK